MSRDERIPRMRSLVESLCGDACAGRATGTAGGQEARRLVVAALRDAGLDPDLQAVPGCGGANVIAAVPGDVDRWVLVAAHYDHLGTEGGQVFRGADDNAAAVAILAELGRALVAARQTGRGVLLAAFDAEEPPNFLRETMGSQHYVSRPLVPLDRTDLMICMDLVGHSVGPGIAPAAVQSSLFALGAERSEGTRALVDRTRADGLYVRRLDAEVVPPMSDYHAFWRAQVPFVFLTAGRWAHYHTPRDVPALLAYHKMSSTAAWLTDLVRAACDHDGPRRFTNAPDDVSTLQTTIELCRSLAEVSAEAEIGLDMAEKLLGVCDARGRLPEGRRHEARALVAAIESRLA